MSSSATCSFTVRVYVYLFYLIPCNDVISSVFVSQDCCELCRSHSIIFQLLALYTYFIHNIIYTDFILSFLFLLSTLHIPNIFFCFCFIFAFSNGTTIVCLWMCLCVCVSVWVGELHGYVVHMKIAPHPMFVIHSHTTAIRPISKSLKEESSTNHADTFCIFCFIATWCRLSWFYSSNGIYRRNMDATISNLVHRIDAIWFANGEMSTENRANKVNGICKCLYCIFKW